jgi:DNA replication protein DnaC
MNEHATIEKLQGMKLYGMAGAFKAAVETGADRSMSVTDLLAQLVDAEWEDKHHRRTDRLARAARFRAVSTVSDIDWLANRNLDKSLVMRLADCRFITEKKTVIVTGSTGVGKSFLAQALGTKTCEMGFATAYWNCAKLFPLLKEQRREGS